MNDLPPSFHPRFSANSEDVPGVPADTNSLSEDTETSASDLERAQQAMHCLGLLSRAWPGRSEPFMTDVLEQLGCSNDRKQLGQRIGRFEIVNELGSGGGGVVYQAWDTKLNRDVALKIPAPHHLVSSDLRRRFMQESRLAAQLKHPNLVTVYEVGEEGSICYIACELCDGPNLTQWLRQQEKPIAPQWAVKCLVQLADATDYMHRQGILHRDLKPSNVLLESKDRAFVPKNGTPTDRFSGGHSLAYTPKITDFGLAKVWQDESEQTKTGTILGTPAYMAPEQAESRLADIGPHTDVYALGCMLYQLLTGQPPYVGNSDAETLRQIVTRDPVAPGRLRAHLSRDLEAICLKCLNYQPQERYASAHDLAADLRRFLAGVPVEARLASPASRMIRWAVRKPVVAGLMMALCLSVAMGSSLVIWQWQQSRRHFTQAQEHFQRAHQAVRDIHALVYKDNDFDAPEFHPLRKEVVSMALEYYEQFQTQDIDDLDLLADIANAYRDIGFLAHSTGSRTDALKHYQKSLELWERLTQLRPEETEYWYFLATVRTFIGQVLIADHRVADALQYLQDAMEVHREMKHLESHPGAVAQTLNVMIEVYEAHNQETDAVQAARQIVSLRKSILEKVPNDIYGRRELAASFVRLGNVYLRFERYEEAIQWCQQARFIFEELTDRIPPAPYAAGNLAYTLGILADAQTSIGQTAEALENYIVACQLLKRITSKHPKNLAYKRRLAAAYLNLGTQQRKMGKIEEARHSHQESLEIAQVLVDSDSKSANLRFLLARSNAQLGRDYLAIERAGDALAVLTQADRILQALLKEQPTNLTFQNWRQKVGRDLEFAVLPQEMSLSQME